MSDIFISYARSTAAQAQAVAGALRGLGYGVWLDDELPAHRAYAEVIEERLKAAKAVVVIWSADAVKSHWVRAEANAALDAGTLLQLTVDGVMPPMPFNQVQCADMAEWGGDTKSAGWSKVVASLADLMGVAPAPTPPALELPSKPSIAVLPFANLSGDPEQDYFADGMVEEITRALSRFKSIFVIGAGSSLSFKGKATTPQDAARTLGVRYVLEGSVRNASGRVRIAVKLIAAADGAQIWTDRFEDTLDDVFALQDKVALSVAGVIGPAVQEAEIRHASSRPTENMSSYDLCLRAQSLYRSLEKVDVLAALDFLKRAIALDPNFGWAMALAVSCHSFIVYYRWSDDPEGSTTEANELIQRALKVAGDDPDVLAHLAMAMPLIGGSREAAVLLADRAMALNPGSPVVWVAGGIIGMSVGEPEVAFEQFETALRLDPLSHSRPVWIGGQGLARFAQGRFREAIALLQQSAQLLPAWPLVHAVLAASFGHLGEANAARAALARYRAVSQVDIWNWGGSLSPDRQKLFRDGIALAEGERPAEIAEGA